MLTWLTTFGKTHLTYIVIILIGLIAFRSWLAEHDARAASEMVVKAEQTQIADLQQQIQAINADTAQKVQVVTKVIHDLGPTPTPAQVIAAVPQLTEVPLNTRAAPDNPVQVSVDALPFVNLLAQAKEDAINLKACTDTSAIKSQQLAAKDIEIAVLRKKPNFWHRVIGTAKAVGVGIGIGAILAAKL